MSRNGRRHRENLHGVTLLEPEDYEARFPPAARAILESGSTDGTGETMKRRRKRGVRLRRKRRRLMPHDWEFICREYGLSCPKPVRHGTATGSKAEVRASLLATVDAGECASTYSLRRLKRIAETNERRADQQVLEKRNSLVRATRKEIAKITVGRRKGPTKTELADAREARTLSFAVDDAVYEALFARQADSFPVPETAETSERLLPARTGGIDWIRIFPRYDQYSPYLEFALAGVDREFFQSNSSSAWAYVIRLGDFVKEVERYESSVG